MIYPSVEDHNFNILPAEGNNNEVRLDDIELMIDTDYVGEIKPPVYAAIVRKWSRKVEPDMEIVVGIPCIFAFKMLSAIFLSITGRSTS